MGLAVHYQLSLAEGDSARVASLLGTMADSARAYGFIETLPPLHLVGAACDVDNCPDPALGWLLIQSKRRTGETAEVPLELHALMTCPGEGCEPANIGFARFASVPGWHWTSARVALSSSQRLITSSKARQGRQFRT